MESGKDKVYNCQMIFKASIGPNAQVINIAAAVWNTLEHIHHESLSDVRGYLYAHGKLVVGVDSGDDTDPLAPF